MEKLLNVLGGVILMTLIYILCYLLSKSHNSRQSLCRIRFNDRVYYTKSIDTISNGGVQFIDVRNDRSVKVFGHYSIESPVKNK